MEILRLARSGDGLSLAREERPRPESLGPEQVLVEVESAALAGPELARAAGRGHPDPGIAAVGRAALAGPGAEHLVGTRVLCGPSIPCGDCARCRRGMPEHCVSREPVGPSGGEALASHVVAGARWLCPLEPPLEVPGPESALLPREAALAYALYVRAGLAPGARAVVLGSGAVARLCLDVLAAQGIRAIAAADGDGWREAAEGADASVARAATAEAIRAAVRAAAPEESAGDVPDAVLETTGEADLRALATELACPGSVAVLAGRGITGAATGEPTPLDAAADAGARVIGVAGAHPDLLPEIAALAARGEIDLAAAAAPAPVADLPALAEALARGEHPGRAGVAVWTR